MSRISRIDASFFLLIFGMGFVLLAYFVASPVIYAIAGGMLIAAVLMWPDKPAKEKDVHELAFERVCNEKPTTPSSPPDESVVVPYIPRIALTRSDAPFKPRAGQRVKVYPTDIDGCIIPNAGYYAIYRATLPFTHSDDPTKDEYVWKVSPEKGHNNSLYVQPWAVFSAKEEDEPAVKEPETTEVKIRKAKIEQIKRVIKRCSFRHTPRNPSNPKRWPFKPSTGQLLFVCPLADDGTYDPDNAYMAKYLGCEEEGSYNWDIFGDKGRENIDPWQVWPL